MPIPGEASSAPALTRGLAGWVWEEGLHSIESGPTWPRCLRDLTEHHGCPGWPPTSPFTACKGRLQFESTSVRLREGWDDQGEAALPQGLSNKMKGLREQPEGGQPIS